VRTRAPMSEMGSFASDSRCPREVRSTPDSGSIAASQRTDDLGHLRTSMKWQTAGRASIRTTKRKRDLWGNTLIHGPSAPTFHSGDERGLALAPWRERLFRETEIGGAISAGEQTQEG
jgi:hypothetical protein